MRWYIFGFFLLRGVYDFSHLLDILLDSSKDMMVFVLCAAHNWGSSNFCGFPQENQILLKKMAYCANI